MKKRLLWFGAALLFGGILQAARVFPAAPDKEGADGMVLIPAGPFWMGLDELPPDTPWGQEDARPKHQVVLPAFYIDRYEVTFGDYQKVDPSIRIPGRTAKFPVTDVTWLDADRYCRAAGKRLPTEAEWEKAARGTDARAYPWGNAFDPKKTNTGLSLMPVGANPDDRSPYGVFDMAGNVSEWTDSWYQPYPGS
ncbi:MAG TPA: SUMF1/EgtB/PvdO family nonheme iron enzyme, partial [Candidatus Manganitrophaceae bacterium]|nr:SUMF1/EgtB/PvdO family nonheme iron enzyme [Candidatus Manganitrophaceae bacterium]